MKESATRTRRKPAASKHFTLEEIAPGAWAAIHKPGGWAIGNAGLIDLGERVLVFDAFLTPQAAADLREASLALTGKLPHAVILSHRHPDHAWGSRVFLPQADLISASQTQHWIAVHSRAEIDSQKETLTGRLRELEGAARTAKGGNGPGSPSAWLDYYRGLAASLPQLEITLPNLTFDQVLGLHGNDSAARLMAFSGGHTESDTILHLPEPGVIFMGDLLFNGCHPYLAEGDPARLLDILKEILSLGAKVYVPGHGPAGGKAEMEKLIKYVDKVVELAGRAASQNQPEEKLVKTPIPKAYAEWEFPEFFAQNLQACYRKARQARETPPQI